MYGFGVDQCALWTRPLIRFRSSLVIVVVVVVANHLDFIIVVVVIHFGEIHESFGRWHTGNAVPVVVIVILTAVLVPPTVRSVDAFRCQQIYNISVIIASVVAVAIGVLWRIRL